MSVRPDGYTLWCDDDDCTEWTAQGSYSKREAVRDARAEGWERVRSDGRLVDLCPLHRSENPATGTFSTAEGTHFYWDERVPESEDPR